ncbi:MAG: hypothetical protein P1U63_06900 [Coxiellaceae bacterium]|nr:hypothetical protein [Coxiellaceae bacterium]
MDKLLRGSFTFLTLTERGTLAKIPWKVQETIAADTTVSHRVQTDIAHFLAIDTVADYLNQLQLWAVSRNRGDQKLLRQCLSSHAQAFPRMNILDDLFAVKNDTMLVDLILTSPVNSAQRVAMLNQFVYLVQQQLTSIQLLDDSAEKTDLLNRLVEMTSRLVAGHVKGSKDVAYHLPLTKLTHLLFSQHPGHTETAYCYFSMLNTLSFAEKTGPVRAELAQLCRIAYENDIAEARMDWVHYLMTGAGHVPIDYKQACDIAFTVAHEMKEKAPNKTVDVIERLLRTCLPDDLRRLQQLSYLYWNGYGCKRDSDKAQYFERRAMDLGDKGAFDRRHPDIRLEDAFVMAQQDCRAAFLHIQQVAKSGSEQGRRAQLMLKTCLEQGYGAVRCRTARTGSALFSVETPPADEHELQATKMMEMRSKVRRHRNAYTFLSNQTNVQLMIVGAKNRSFKIDPYTKDDGREGTTKAVGLNAIHYYSKQYASVVSSDDEKLRWSHIVSDLKNMDNGYTPQTLRHQLDSQQAASIATGWYKHAITLSVFKIDGVHYMAYSNQGQHGEGAIKFFQINDPTLLNDEAWLSKIQSSEFDEEYMCALDAGNPGLVADLKLTPLCSIEKTRQRTGNCVLKSGYSAVLIHLIQQQLTQNHGGGVLTADEVKATAANVIAEQYKPWRQYLRASAVTTLCDLGSAAEGCRVAITPNEHCEIMAKVIEEVDKKYSGANERTASIRQYILQGIVDFVRSSDCPYVEIQKEWLLSRLTAVYPHGSRLSLPRT